MPAMRSVHIDTARTWRGGQNQVLMTVTGLAEAGHQAMLVAHEAGELRRRASEGLRFIGFSPRSEFDVHAGWQLARVLRRNRTRCRARARSHGRLARAMALQMQTGAPATAARGRLAPGGFSPETARVLEMEVPATSMSSSQRPK